MKKFVRIEAGIVTNIIALEHAPNFNDEAEQALWQEVPPKTVVEYCYTRNGDGSFSPPIILDPEPAAPKRQFTFLEFMDLFTGEEQLTLVEASMTLPGVKLWYDKALGAQFIALDDPRTEAGLQMLVDESLITTARKTSVMAGQGPA